MNHLLFAAQPETQIAHHFSRLNTMTEWWQWFALVAAAVAIIVYVAVMYRRDCAELSRGLRWGLFALRLAALGGILFYFFDLEKREERRLVRNSRAVVLVDTSLSMGIQDSGTSGTERRIDAVIEEFSQRDFLKRLRDQHDVVVYRFDQLTNPVEVVALPRVARAADSDQVSSSDAQGAALAESRLLAFVAGVLGGVAVLSFLTFLVAYWVTRKSRSSKSAGEGDGAWSLLVAMVAMIAGVVVLSVASLRHPEFELAAIIGLKEPAAPDDVTTSSKAEGGGQGETKVDLPETEWTEVLAPRGTETRLGDALRFLINKERGGPIAGIVVFSDGGNNAGSDYEESVVAARAAKIPVYNVGLGSDRRPTNVRIVDLEAPPRVFPGDKFQITAFVQSFGLTGRSVKLQLNSATGRDSNEQSKLEDERSVTLAPDGELIPVKFELTPSQAGLTNYLLHLTAPTQDTDPRDNDKSATVQVVERKNHVLLFAGGPTREFQFLRNMLFRDRDTTVDVFLQSGAPGISQEADELLFEFPSLAEELFDYDCIVAFDPDWTQLSDAQASLLERWVAEKAGGLILVAGPVETPKLMNRSSGERNLELIRGLYPVTFYGRGSATLSLSRSTSETPWPLAFTREGESADFLRLEDDPSDNRQAWTSYPGIYGYFAVKDPKPGANVLARFSDPSTSIDGSLPVYMATQFYGAGRVFYQGSGEMWWLRQVSDAYFERYYTKLIRWVSQGRLLRDSSRGVLLVDKDRCLVGETVSVQAMLTDAQHEPLTAAEVISVIVKPDGQRANLTLRHVEDAARPGTYTAQFAAALEGDYRLELPLPGSVEGEMLRREVRARIPTLETERPERNDALLKDLAEKTGGKYLVGVAAATNRGTGTTPIANLLEPQEQVTYLPGTPDREFDRLLMSWLMAVICGALFVEWLVRRLVKLA